ncbi:coiled-coil protein [Legionella gratiana]|uniref:Coiled-coil protein n=1 Tax=Legionella gratiana TaxID=45066 RepID=A0A378JHW5_9GAMM|nr:hypothetical protein [Legionella gratiana]KTD11829.1 coiled-coil protein [Legionella gratiana]STX46581.1 coiled-coil protein [Legionella gratiana]
MKDDKSEILPIRRSPRRSPPREPVGEHVDPAISSKDDDSETLTLALSQTISARASLYWPSTELRDELGVAASGLIGYLDFLKTQEDGNELIIGLCARVLGPEGLDPQELFIEATKKGSVDNPEELAKFCRGTLERHLSSVQDELEGPELGHSRAITIALLGDIGAFMTATGATTGTVRDEKVSRRLKESFSDYALQLEGKTSEYRDLVDESAQRGRMLGGGGVIGPTKSKERKRVEEEELIPRTGIHDCGKDADELLGRFEKEGHLVPTKWASARLHEKRVTTIEEPLAGHMSASPSEILWTWDILAGRGIDSAYVGNPGKETDFFSSARAAGACAFLVGCGYHSALEVLHGTMIYVGQDPQHVLPEAVEMRCEETGFVEPMDAGALFHSGAATSLVDELLHDVTSGVGRNKAQSSIEFVHRENSSIEAEHKESSSIKVERREQPSKEESVEPKTSTKRRLWQVLQDIGFKSVAVPGPHVAAKLEELSKTNPQMALKCAEEYLAFKKNKKSSSDKSRPPEYIQDIKKLVAELSPKEALIHSFRSGGSSTFFKRNDTEPKNQQGNQFNKDVQLK